MYRTLPDTLPGFYSTFDVIMTTVFNKELFFQFVIQFLQQISDYHQVKYSYAKHSFTLIYCHIHCVTFHCCLSTHKLYTFALLLNFRMPSCSSNIHLSLPYILPVNYVINVFQLLNAYQLQITRTYIYHVPICIFQCLCITFFFIVENR